MDTTTAMYHFYCKIYETKMQLQELGKTKERRISWAYRKNPITGGAR